MLKQKQNTVLACKLETVGGALKTSNLDYAGLDHAFSEYKRYQERLLVRSYIESCMTARQLDVIKNSRVLLEPLHNPKY